MTYKIVVSVSAYTDLKFIKDYIGFDNQTVAKEYTEKILERIESLSQFPRKGTKIQNPLLDYADAWYLVCLNHILYLKVTLLKYHVYLNLILSYIP